MMKISSNDYQGNREALLANIIQNLLNDERILAAWLTGSYASGNADALSDLDLTLVIADAYSESLCLRTAQVSSQTTPERLNLFSRFGTPAIIYENNNNAPDGGTLTSIFYARSAIMVDWILVPRAKAQRPLQAIVLFEKTSIPLRVPAEPESLDMRLTQAAEMMAFFWMMTAISAKYLIRKDYVFVTSWLEQLHKLLSQVEHVVEGKSWEYPHGSLSTFLSTEDALRLALLQLGEKMEALIPQIIRMGGQVLPSPMSEIRTLLSLDDEK
jgi:hypothetical protein